MKVVPTCSKLTVNPHTRTCTCIINLSRAMQFQAGRFSGIEIYPRVLFNVSLLHYIHPAIQSSFAVNKNGSRELWIIHARLPAVNILLAWAAQRYLRASVQSHWQLVVAAAGVLVFICFHAHLAQITTSYYDTLIRSSKWTGKMLWVMCIVRGGGSWGLIQ